MPHSQQVEGSARVVFPRCFASRRVDQSRAGYETDVGLEKARSPQTDGIGETLSHNAKARLVVKGV
eukprot:6054558-Lingulodinium_polyedra.AAC.1